MSASPSRSRVRAARGSGLRAEAGREFSDIDPVSVREPARNAGGQGRCETPTLLAMNDNRSGGMLLIAGSVAGLITMGLHPVAPHGPTSPQAMESVVLLNRTVHGLAIAGLPMLFLGALALTRRLTNANRLPLAALVIHSFAAVAIMIAASLSGFVGSDLMSHLSASDPAAEMTRLLLAYTFRLNQAFSSVYVVGACAAIFLWSFAIVRTRRLTAGLGIYGLVLGPLIVAALFSGHLPLNVHGFGLVVLSQAAWFIVAGTLLMRSTELEDDQENSVVPRANVILTGSAS